MATDSESAFTSHVSGALDHGENLFLLGSHNNEIENLKRIGDPARLAEWHAHGLDHINLEMDPKPAAALNALAAQGLPAEEVAQRFQQQVGAIPEYAKAVATLAVNARAAGHGKDEGIAIHGEDHIAETLGKFAQKLTPQEVRSFVGAEAKQLRGSQNFSPPEKAVIKKFEDATNRTGTDEENLASNYAIAQGLAKDNKQQGSMTLYGLGHGLNANNLPEMLAQQTGKPVETVLLDGGKATRGMAEAVIAESRKLHPESPVNIPDFRYDAAHHTMQALPGGHTNDSNAAHVADWHKIKSHPDLHGAMKGLSGVVHAPDASAPVHENVTSGLSQAIKRPISPDTAVPQR